MEDGIEMADKRDQLIGLRPQSQGFLVEGNAPNKCKAF